MKAMWKRILCFSLVLAFILALGISARAEVMLQWFESDWDEMYRRMPEVAEIGYDYIWTPPPTKGPTGKGVIWANVGYNLWDRFDVGQIPQRGSLATRYGTAGSLKCMVQAAHQLDVKIIPDIVMNHNGNGPDFREYPGMHVEDFHVTYSESYVNGLNYNRARRMDQWSANNGYGGTMWQELAQLIDIRTEDHPLNPDPLRFTGPKTIEGHFFDFVGSRPDYIRHPGQFEMYPYYPAGYETEMASEMLYRWIAWLGDEMDYDGLRLDAGKHTPWEFFGTKGSGFLHEAQFNYNVRRGYSDANPDEADEVFENYLAERDDALIFAEILSPFSEIEYWFGGGTRNPMRFLDYQQKQSGYRDFQGNLAATGQFGSDFGPNNGILYVWGHDEGPPQKVDIAYAYILTHIGMPMVYFTGNNILWENHGRAPYDPGNPTANKTWMIPGYDSHALADGSGALANLVWIHQQFAWGSEHKLWENDGDYFALERYSDVDSNGRDSGDALLVMAINDSGGDQTRFLSTSFENGTVLKDYTGNNASEVTVGAAGGVNITVPGMGGQGWVCYAPKNADPLTCDFIGPGITTIDWWIPGGTHAADKFRQFTRITSSNFTVSAHFGTPGGAVDNVMIKWGQGEVKLGSNTHFTNDNDHVVGYFEKMNQVDGTNWTLDVALTENNIPEGLNVVKIRAFNQRTLGLYPALFNTETKVVYVDRRGPDLDIEYPVEGQTVVGDAVMIIKNPDYTAYTVDVVINSVTNSAHQIMKGCWKYSLVGLPAGPLAIEVKATEADWDSPRTIINQSSTTRIITAAANPNAIALSHADGATLEVPFFDTTVTAGGSPDVVTLKWDGYTLPFNNGSFSNIFNGEVIHDADPSNVVPGRLWGAFVNGPHYFEACRVDGSVTSRTVACVTFNLYGNNHIDSDGDGLPDNVEMPFFDQGAPGPDQPWPGDDNDFVPESWENWSRLNPYNHSTFYSGQWDDGIDSDGDGWINKNEVLAGYCEDGNIYKYDIYDSGSAPSAPPTCATNSAINTNIVVASRATWFPSNGVPRGAQLQITYYPEDGSLNAASQVVMHVGHSKKTLDEWQDVLDTNMTEIVAGCWQVSYTVPSNATSVDLTFFDGESTWDGTDWQALVAGDTNFYFTMDGAFDGENYLIFEGAAGKMEIRGAVKNENLYIATHAAGGGGSDHFVFVTDELGDGQPAQWAKAGTVFFDVSSKPYLAGEGASGFEDWFNATGPVGNFWPGALEGELNLVDVFGNVPEALYVAAVAYVTSDGGGIVAQGPDLWEGGDNLDIMEFLRVPVSSIRDDDMDGYFDCGSPQMWTTVSNDTQDANYALRRFFLDETAGETATITVRLWPNGGLGNAITDVELFSNINRRDFAVIEEDPDSVASGSASNYFRAYPMTGVGGGFYEKTLTIDKCGAYRINARYKVNGGAWCYYADNGLRRECAVVVSPRKALDICMYEANPLIIEATNDVFEGRSTFADMYVENTNKLDRVNTNYFVELGVNMIWLQPFHPIGSDNRGIDPVTSNFYDPGSPYAVRNYWEVNAALGRENTRSNAMDEFVAFVGAMDAVGVGVMPDGTFNHSAWDCEIGNVGVDMYSWASNETTLIRNVRPEWYSKRDNYDDHASYYFSANDTDIASAPDRIDFGKWPDAADFNFGTYDTLVQKPAGDTNNAWFSSWFRRHLREEDRFEGHDTFTREIWEYFAFYPIYWLEKTGHPVGTPPEESYRGIDGLRCDFAQGLPNTFWEYCINRTRSVKWDFIFMAESLDGFVEVDGSKRHGVGYRSARHFDILNENFVFYWRNQFFDYPDRNNEQPFTFPTKQAYDERREAFDVSPILLNLTSHDEIFPSHDPYRLVYAYAELAALDGAPLMFYGQEAGARNDFDTYELGGEIPNSDNNFEHYELNFGKSIPNFKRYNSMKKIWTNADGGLYAIYRRLNWARKNSPALRSQGVYFLADDSTGNENPDMFAVARFEEAGVSASTQEVVFCFVNNSYWGIPDGNGEDISATFRLNPTTAEGLNWFGIEDGNVYNIVDLVSTDPTQRIWGADVEGSVLTNNGIFVGLNQPAGQGGQVQFLRLIDVNAPYPDSDGDGLPDYSDPDDDNDDLPDDYETANGLDPNDATGDNGKFGDKDGDGVSNYHEMLAGTDPDDTNDFLEIVDVEVSGGGSTVSWPTVEGRDYRLECADDIGVVPVNWAVVRDYVTAATNMDSYADVSITSNRFYRVRVRR